MHLSKFDALTGDQSLRVQFRIERLASQFESDLIIAMHGPNFREETLPEQEVKQ